MNAALIAVNFSTGETLTQIFDGDNPALELRNFKTAIENDFTGFEFGAIVDDEAQKKWADYYVPILLGKQAGGCDD